MNRLLLTDNAEFDVVVVGSGAGGMVAAIRASELGLRPILIEKSDRYGGTSAISGSGLWIPNNSFIRDVDSAEKGLEYLKATTEGFAPHDKLERYVNLGPVVVDWLRQNGVDYYVNPSLHYPDYHPDQPGALPHGRAMFVRPIDGADLGDEFFNLRESYPEFKLLGRITIDLDEGGAMIHHQPGWIRMLATQLARYWLDLPWRMKTHRDRRLAHGNALIGGLRKTMLKLNIPLALKTRLLGLVREGNRVTSVRVDHDGREILLRTRRGVILAAGGFEQSQELRTRYLPASSRTEWSVTPRGNNSGDALNAAVAAGASVDMMGECWWAPSISMPSNTSPNLTRAQGIFFERGLPHSICVNKAGRRFVNEAVSYHRFGEAMLRDQAATGENIPCWMIFDARYRKRYPLGGIMPGEVVPDRKLPPNWFDTFLYRANSISELASKIGLPSSALTITVERFNRFAAAGTDEEFGRGGDFYNRFLGDPRHGPNPCLGEVAEAPFYAVRLDLGDLGSKGGPKTDVDARVLDEDDKPIAGLYAVGNCAATLMGKAYPGAGVTLGSTMIFGYTAASHLGGANTLGAVAQINEEAPV